MSYILQISKPACIYSLKAKRKQKKGQFLISKNISVYFESIDFVSDGVISLHKKIMAYRLLETVSPCKQN